MAPGLEKTRSDAVAEEMDWHISAADLVDGRSRWTVLAGWCVEVTHLSCLESRQVEKHQKQALRATGSELVEARCQLFHSVEECHVGQDGMVQSLDRRILMVLRVLEEVDRKD